MGKIDPIIAVKNVEASSLWYCSVLNCQSLHGGKDFDVLVDEQGEVLLCLHEWGADGHPTMMDASIIPGNGLILYFRTENMQALRNKVEKLGYAVEEDMHLNENSMMQEFSLRDPDGYFLTITEYHRYGG